jgi:hypothetical protein
MPPTKKSTSDTVYQLKVTLIDSKPPIWRRVQVPSDISMAQLHAILQIVMGWTDSHLHQFVVGGQNIGIPDPDFGMEVRNERTVKLSQCVRGEKSKFMYEYDFGDSWQHQILIEKILTAEPGARYPICLAGKRACPPEDCGGVWGYDTLLETIRDPNNPEHDDMIEWLGGDFDPEAFDLEEINRELKPYQAKMASGENKRATAKRRAEPAQEPPAQAESEQASPTKPSEESVPKLMQPIYSTIVGMTDAICIAHLSEEYAQLCRKMAATLARKRPSPLTRSKPQTWACGIAYALGSVNFLFDKTQTPHMSAGELCELFGVAKSTGAAKSREIQDTLDITLMDPRWCLPSKLADNPMAWMIQVNGLIVDARHAPRHIQAEAFRRGLIPYIPE